MRPLSPLDLTFLVLERRNQPMHVGGLFLATPPENAGDDFIQNMVRTALESNHATPPFNLKLNSKGGVKFWVEDDEFDLEAHVYHLALPKPGRIRELLALVSKLHSSLLDRSKPLWEVYIIEGVEDGRIAVYSKIHHAMVDGVAAMRLMQRATGKTPEDSVNPLWALPPKPQKPVDDSTLISSPIQLMANGAKGIGKAAGSATKIASEVFKSIRARSKEKDYVSVFQAPKTLFNQRVTASRRFAAQSWSLERIAQAGKKHNATVNDIVLAMCGATLRRYLQERQALPDKPLIAMVPVSLRQDESDGGNQIAMILANLATHLSDPVERLHTIQGSVNNSKKRYAGMKQAEIMGYLSTIMTAHGANMALGLNPSFQAFNVIISNVPGPKEVRYWNGARIDGLYPVSIVMDGEALNITLNSYAGNLEFGLIGCQRTVPHLQHMLTYLEDALAELE